MSTNVIRGAVRRAQKVCVYGPEGVGKTSFAALFPRPLFLDLERGSCSYNVDRAYPETVREVEEILDFVLAGGTGYETVVLDTYDALWHLYARQVAAAKGVNSVEEVAYGNGVKVVADLLWRLLKGRVEGLVKAGVHVVFLAHADVRKHDDVEAGTSYDRYMFRAQRLSANHLMQEMDTVLFANFDARIIHEANGKVRATGGTERVLHTVRTAAYDAKNRLGLPKKMSLCVETVEKLLGGPLPHPWDVLVEGYTDEQVADFLVKAGYLAEGQSWRELDETLVARGLGQPERLCSRLAAHTAQTTAA
jgi:hypothetical protein